ncbi:MAG: 2-amino-4-hydroxy-6-hydroxymethyldihydropteridine diphosphokinase [Myxococcales bacterium]|nr:2-amino-4-hydroxy-6-hydroxymethyldihydropteridine diphosphokinase [Myxococcales bacterium]
MAQAAIGIGSSLGDRVATVRAALEDLDRLPSTRLLRASRLYESEPVGGVALRRFINACAVLETALPPRELLAALLAVEARHHRERAARWADRTLDLDLLLYDELALDDPRLTLPHPEMADRAFVLIPLAEIAPDWRHPGRQATIAELAGLLSNESRANVRLYP